MKSVRRFFEELSKAELEPTLQPTQTTIAYRHGWVVLYAKSAVNLVSPFEGRSIAEPDLPGRLVGDFASLTSGLLPGIALTSLTAVRAGARRVLDTFRNDLDPAFLSHRACLTNPDDAEFQIVSHVAEEFRGLMDYAVLQDSPAGSDAVENWIRERGIKNNEFKFGSERLSLEETIALANNGLHESQRLKNNAFETLTSGFSQNGESGINERLAWIMSFRTVEGGPPPCMWLGSVVTKHIDDDEQHLICLRPRCDCVRLTEVTPFFFLPLVEPMKNIPQIVVRLNDRL